MLSTGARMDSAEWQRVVELYEAALAVDADRRTAFVAKSAAGDEGLRREVESLLAQEETPVLIDRPLDDAAAAVLASDGILDVRTRIGPYRIDAVLGAGGMGVVYRASDTRLHRTVALKVLSPALRVDPRFRARFEREA